MLDSIITSKTRIKLLLKFFLNSNARSYLRGLESEFGESSNAIRLELNRMEGAGLLNSSVSGNKKVFSANTKHPLFGDIHNIVMKHIGLDRVVEEVIDNLGDLDSIYLVGEFAKGKDSPIIDLAFFGEALDKAYLMKLVEKAESMINRKVRYLIYQPKEEALFLSRNSNVEALLLWKR